LALSILVIFYGSYWFSMEAISMDKAWKRIIELDGFFIEENDDEIRVVDQNGKLVQNFMK
jgi:hypothetical protein